MTNGPKTLTTTTTRKLQAEIKSLRMEINGLKWWIDYRDRMLIEKMANKNTINKKHNEMIK